jgi:hypothetical protein
MEDQTNRPHRKSREKKKKHDGMWARILPFPTFPSFLLYSKDLNNCFGLMLRRMICSLAGPNPKAFALANPGRGKRQAARSHDVCLLPFSIDSFLLISNCIAIITGEIKVGAAPKAD